MAFDNIVGRTSMDAKQPHMHTKITQSSMTQKENKYRHSAKDMFNRIDLKSFHKDLSSEIVEREFNIGRMKTRRRALAQQIH